MQPFALEKREQGVYCPKGDFFIDPWGEVEASVITHAHGDHARVGASVYYCAQPSKPLLQHRLGANAVIVGKDYGEKFKLGNTWLSFHPAGHILGSAQVRIEVESHVTVVSGDYKRQTDPTCLSFEAVPCDEFLTESTFALPIYRWPEPQEVAEQILHWWEKNAAKGQASILFCYALGKAQRIMALLGRLTDRPVLLHGAMTVLTTLYEEQEIALIPWKRVQEVPKSEYAGSLILAPPSAFGSIWMRKFEPYKTAAASGWMSLRGTRRRAAYDKGFVLSDHADWEALLATIHETKAQKIWTTHGNEDVLSRYLTEVKGMIATPLRLHEWSEEAEE